MWRTADCTYAHAWRGSDGGWHESRIPAVVGTRPKLVFDRDDNAYAVFGSGPTPGIRSIDRHLVIAAATRAADWKDWHVVFTLPDASVGEPLVDHALMRSDGMLSVFLQDSPTQKSQPTAIRVVDFAVGR